MSIQTFSKKSTKPISKRHVCTIFCHGTGQHSNIKKDGNVHKMNFELINSIHKLSEATDAVKGNVLILEGVGSKGNPGAWQVNPASGQLERFKDSKPGLVKRLLQGATGDSKAVKKNINNALEWLYIQKTKMANNLPITVNIVGWSRGAVEAIRIAYNMENNPNNAFKGCEVNIFAIDPVAGPMHDKEVEAWTLEKNVTNYVALLATRENRSAFTPTSRKDNLRIVAPKITRYVPLTFPALHESIVQDNNYAGRLVNHLGYRFLEWSGVVMREDVFAKIGFSDASCLCYYTYLSMGLSGKVGKTGNMKAIPKKQSMFMMLTTGVSPKKRKVHEYQSLSHGFFINIHHRALFKSLLPYTYDYYFGEKGAANYVKTVVSPDPQEAAEDRKYKLGITDYSQDDRAKKKRVYELDRLVSNMAVDLQESGRAYLEQMLALNNPMRERVIWQKQELNDHLKWVAEFALEMPLPEVLPPPLPPRNKDDEHIYATIEELKSRTTPVHKLKMPSSDPIFGSNPSAFKQFKK